VFSVETEDVPTMNKASERRAHEFEKALAKSEGVEAAEHLSKVSMSTSLAEVSPGTARMKEVKIHTV
jgi:hypothetical protein